MTVRARPRNPPVDPETWFWLRTVRNGECLESTFAAPQVYPRYSISLPGGEKKTVITSRYAWESLRGPIPNGLCVCHTCDNPLCVRIEHLFLGTINDNNQDKVRKGRQRNLAGENHPNALLSKNTVQKIKAGRKQGRLLRELAKEFNVSMSTISLVANGKAWKNKEEKRT